MQNRQVQNAHNHRHLQAAHQAQHGGVRLHGIKVGRRGTRTDGKTINCHINGKAPQSRIHALEVQRCQWQLKSFVLYQFFFFLQWLLILAVSRPDSSNCHERDAVYIYHNYLCAQTHIFLGSRISQKHCHLFVMSLLGVLFIRFPLVASSPTCSLSRTSASSTTLARTRLNSCASAHWSRSSGCLANPTPQTMSTSTTSPPTGALSHRLAEQPLLQFR